MLAGLSPARRRMVLVVLALAVAAAVALTGVLVARSSGSATRAGRPGRGPGRCCWCPATAGAPDRCSRWPTSSPRRGGTPPWSSLPGDGTGDLNASADALGAAASTRRWRGPASRRVDVVGYSAGGLVARLWVADGARRRGPPRGHARARRTTARRSPTWPARCAGASARWAAGRWPATATCWPASTPATRRRTARPGCRSGRRRTRRSPRRTPRGSTAR